MARKSKINEVIGYASCWLAFSNVELGLLAEAETSAEKALEHGPAVSSLDQYLSSKPHTALGFIHWFEGSGKKRCRDANHLLEHGKRFENLRSTVMGYCIAGVGAFANGDIPSAIESFKVAVDTTEDPLYIKLCARGLSFGNAAGRHYGQAKWAAKEVVISAKRGTEVLGTYVVIPICRWP